MRVTLHREVDVAAPARAVWHYVMDWTRQDEWIPFTRAEPVDSGRGMGARARAWTGIGALGFWDPMTITGWEEQPDGSGRCEVLHTGAVVRGEGEFTVVPRGPDRCTFGWTEQLELPAGRLGGALWRLALPLTRAAVDATLARLADRFPAA